MPKYLSDGQNRRCKIPNVFLLLKAFLSVNYKMWKGQKLHDIWKVSRKYRQYCLSLFSFTKFDIDKVKFLNPDPEILSLNDQIYILFILFSFVVVKLSWKTKNSTFFCCLVTSYSAFIMIQSREIFVIILA